MLDVQNNINKRINIVFTESNLTQEQFGQSIGVTKGYINNILKGRNVKVSDPVLRIIAIVYRKNFTWLKTGEGPMDIAAAPVFAIEITTIAERMQELKEKHPTQYNKLQSAMELFIKGLEEDAADKKRPRAIITKRSKLAG